MDCGTVVAVMRREGATRWKIHRSCRPVNKQVSLSNRCVCIVVFFFSVCVVEALFIPVLCTHLLALVRVGVRVCAFTERYSGTNTVPQTHAKKLWLPVFA